MKKQENISSLIFNLNATITEKKLFEKLKETLDTYF